MLIVIVCATVGFSGNGFELSSACAAPLVIRHRGIQLILFISRDYLSPPMKRSGRGRVGVWARPATRTCGVRSTRYSALPNPTFTKDLTFWPLGIRGCRRGTKETCEKPLLLPWCTLTGTSSLRNQYSKEHGPLKASQPVTSFPRITSLESR